MRELSKVSCKISMIWPKQSIKKIIEKIIQRDNLFQNSNIRKAKYSNIFETLVINRFDAHSIQNNKKKLNLLLNREINYEMLY